MTWDMDPHEMLTLLMPRFTDGSALSLTDKTARLFDVIIEPSTLFSVAWLEGHWNSNYSPYNSSKLIFVKKPYFAITTGEVIHIKIYASNGLMAYCGFPAWDAKYDVRSTNPMESFQLISNRTGLASNKFTLQHPQMGLGCSLHGDCNGRGSCDFCTEKCTCDTGWGAPTDIITKGDVINKHCFQSKYFIHFVFCFAVTIMITNAIITTTSNFDWLLLQLLSK